MSVSEGRKLEMVAHPEKITINNTDFKVVLEYKPKKNSSAKVYGDTIVVRLTNSVSKKRQTEHINYLLGSIKRKLMVRKIQAAPFILDLTQDLILKDQTFKFKLSFENRKTSRAKITNDNVIEIKLPVDFTEEEKSETIKKLVLKVLSIHLQDYLTNYVNEINKRTYNFTVNKSEFKIFRSKWGECSDRGVLTLNILLLFCPEEVFEYIIIHELAHLGLLNHSKVYWQRVESVCPERKVREMWLKRNGSNILNMKIVY